ncbi:MAG: hypothetical protein LBJ16_03755 [Holosporaceae bacterium]|nr:hypothetical protein [Holosporaceae bacterium]
MVHHNPSTEATQKLPKERMFRKKSISCSLLDEDLAGEILPGVVLKIWNAIYSFRKRLEKENCTAGAAPDFEIWPLVLKLDRSLGANFLCCFVQQSVYEGNFLRL